MSAELAPVLASIIVLNHNGRRFLDPCLTAVLDQELDAGFEVLLVDNASRDGSVDFVRSRFPAVTVVETEANLGYAGGNNVGIGRARGLYIVLLNNDTKVRPGWLTALVAAAGEPQVGAITSKLVFMERPDVVQNAGSMVLTDGSGADRGAGEADQGQYGKREEVFAACGCGMLLTRTMLEDVGLLDSTFFAYYEDTDLSWRMRLRGWRILYEPTAVVEHLHSGTSVEWSPFFTFHVDRNRLFMILKNAPLDFAAGAFARFAWQAAKGSMRAVGKAFRQGPQPSKAGGASRNSRAAIHLRVLASLMSHLPEMLAKRHRIRQGRRVADQDILRWFYPRERWDAR